MESRSFFFFSGAILVLKGLCLPAMFVALKVRDYAVIPRRLTELVAQVDEVAQRLVSIVKKVSVGSGWRIIPVGKYKKA